MLKSLLNPFLGVYGVISEHLPLLCFAMIHCYKRSTSSDADNLKHIAQCLEGDDSVIFRTNGSEVVSTKVEGVSELNLKSLQTFNIR